jgi:beta-N-acetylhexosaminidase
MSRRIAGLVVLACATVLCACGGDEQRGDATTQPASPTAAAVPATTTVAPAPPPQITHAERVAKLRPPIVPKPIPLPDKRKREMVAYAARHYGIATATLTHPKVIVEHYTVTPDVQSTYDVFAPDQPDVELHELPGLCSQFVIGRDGTIYQLTPLSFMCRHTVGLNYTAIGIEHVGSSDQEILSNPAQLRASLRLTRWLRCRSHISVKNVIGHNESLSSPYHHEQVAGLRAQTHADWVRADMQIYRRKLAAQGACPR